MIDQLFRKAMADKGIETKDTIICDMRLHRFHIEGDKVGSKNGWYIVYPNRPVMGVFGSWKTDEKHVWCIEDDKPHRVLYIDGEMSAIAMQQRLSKIVESSSEEPPEDYFTLLTPDMQERGMPDISTVEGQEALKPYTDEAEFIVVDNLSTLVRTGKENEAESWLPIQQWALEMRSQGKSVLFIHHAGKSGQQRGSSRREDVLDLVMELRHPEG